MNRIHLKNFPEHLLQSAKAVLLVFLITAPMVLIGRGTLGEAVIAMIYLGVVGLASSRWGQLAGISAALAAALTFDFFFTTPYYTFVVSELEDWLVLSIFLAVAILVVGRIEAALSKAHTSERDAKLMYELGMALAGLRTRQAVLHALAWNLRQMFRATLVEVTMETEAGSVPAIVKAPADVYLPDTPERIVPIQAAPGLIGEIHIWQGDGWLPHEDSRLLQDFASLAATALERARATEIELRANTLAAVADRQE